MRLEQWSIVFHGDLYKAPEQRIPRLLGAVYGHPIWPDGSLARTSPIDIVDAETETITTASGSVYELGEVDPAYEEKYPGARERIFAQEESDEHRSGK